MKGLVWHGKNDIRLEDVPMAPPPGPGEVRVRVAYCGICGTDIEEYTDGPINIPVGSPHPLTGKSAPLILGHEFSGVVESVGEGVTDLRPGDRVATETTYYCGDCEACRNHLYNLCVHVGNLGLHADGGLAEYVTGRAAVFCPIPDHLSLREAALVESVSVAVRGLRLADVKLGDDVLVMGGGTIGLLAAQVARIVGAGRVSLVEPVASRREVASALGVDRVLTPEELDGRPQFDKAIDCTGKSQAQIAALRSLKAKGRLVAIGIPVQPNTVDFLDLILYEREIVGSLSHVIDEDFTTAIQILADGRVRVEPLITAVWPLERAVEAFELLRRGGEGQLKILLAPGESSEVKG